MLSRCAAHWGTSLWTQDRELLSRPIGAAGTRNDTRPAGEELQRWQRTPAAGICCWRRPHMGVDVVGRLARAERPQGNGFYARDPRRPRTTGATGPYAGMWLLCEDGIPMRPCRHGDGIRREAPFETTSSPMTAPAMPFSRRVGLCSASAFLSPVVALATSRSSSMSTTSAPANLRPPLGTCPSS